MVGGEHVGGGNMAAGVALAAPARRLGLGLCVGSELNSQPAKERQGWARKQDDCQVALESLEAGHLGVSPHGF